MSNKIKDNLVTPIIVTYNSSEYIRGLLNSLEQFRNIIYEIIIIENNSPEIIQTLKIIEQYKKTSSITIRMIKSTSNIGFGKSCNIGAVEAKSKYLIFINPDSVVQPNAINILIKDLKKSKAIAIGGKCIKNDGSVHRTAVRHPNLITGIFEFTNLGKLFRTDIGVKSFYYNEDIYYKNQDTYVDAVSGAFLLVNKDVFNKLGGFDTSYFMYLEDVDFGNRAMKAGYRILFCPHAILFHLGGGSSNNRDKILHSAWFKSRKIYYFKNSGILINTIVQPLFLIEELLIKLKLKYDH